MSATLPAEAGHDPHDHHDHPAWLAHHFEDAEQQFDAGKLGMWLFLVTEILFFSGMFCAYALYRSSHPEIFQFASNFLNKFLGAINTGVLLFSSLTMAWAVRAAQLSQHRTLVGMLGATLGCASIFLGVKAVEYTHKWDSGLLPAAYYTSQVPGHAAHSNWLTILCIPALIVFIGSFVWYFVTLVSRNAVQRQVAGPVLVAAICFFGGVKLGQILTAGEEAAHASEHHASAGADHSHDHSKAGHDEPAASDDKMVALTSESSMYESQAFPKEVRVDVAEQDVPNYEVNQKGKAGLFFSIYYAMTGVHAIHILAGMAVLTWLIYRGARKEFHSKYFGPVDNVGLYWHLVDFIWIYLFPLLYLIT